MPAIFAASVKFSAAVLNQQLAPIVDLELFQRLGISHFTLSAGALGLITGL